MNGSDLYFLFSKLITYALTPSALLAIGLVIAFGLLFTPLRHRGRTLLGLVLVGYVGFAILPGGAWLVNVLENRFAVVQSHAEPVAGIIVLAGPISTALTRARGQVSLGGGAERLTEFMRLALIHPHAKLVFSGGIGLLSGQGPTEAEVAKRFYSELGFAGERIWFEDGSRNTGESAALTYHKLKPQPGERWLLITSARHMPRAMGYFRHAGWDVTAHPVDFYTAPGGLGISWPPSMGYLNAAVYEWGGLLVAWLRGRIDEPFPGPRAVAQGKPE